MLDVVAELIEFLLAAGGIPGPESVEGQRRARLVAAIVALVTILGGQLFSGTTAGVVFVAAGAVVGLWILAFSVVDLIKEFPPVRWQSVMAVIVAGAALAVALEYTLLEPSNHYQASPSQGRRSSPSGRRQKPRRRKSKRDR